MLRYAQINMETGVVQGETWLTKEVHYPHMILLEEPFDLTNKKYIDGKWVEYEPEVEEPVTPASDLMLEKLETIEAKIQTNEDLQIFYNEIVKEVGL